MSDTVAKDMVVGIEYALRLSDGQEIDRSEKDEPLEYLHGHRNIIPGLEHELAGMRVGDTKEVVVNPAEGYGEYDPASVEEHPRSSFPPGLKLEQGSVLEMRDPNRSGYGRVALVKAVGEDTVTLDFNHPLAGEKLYFSIKVVSLRPATAEELTHGHAHGVHGHH